MNTVTFGQLDATMRSFGLRVREVAGKGRVYEHPQLGIIHVLPNRPLREKAQPFHIASSRKLLEEFGIARPDEFTARLIQSQPSATA